MLVIKIYFLIPFVCTHTYGVANPLIYVLISPCIRYASSLSWKCWHRCQLILSTYLVLIKFARLHVYVGKQARACQIQFYLSYVWTIQIGCERVRNTFIDFDSNHFPRKTQLKISYSWNFYTIWKCKNKSIVHKIFTGTLFNSVSFRRINTPS